MNYVSDPLQVSSRYPALRAGDETYFPFVHVRRHRFLTVVAAIGCSRDRCVIYSVSVKKDSLLVYLLRFFGIWAGRRVRGGVVVKGERLGYKRSEFYPELRFSFLFNKKQKQKQKLSITGQKFLSVLKKAATVNKRDNYGAETVNFLLFS